MLQFILKRAGRPGLTFETRQVVYKFYKQHGCFGEKKDFFVWKRSWIVERWDDQIKANKVFFCRQTGIERNGWSQFITVKSGRK